MRFVAGKILQRRMEEPRKRPYKFKVGEVGVEHDRVEQWMARNGYSENYQESDPIPGKSTCLWSCQAKPY